jgi:hypothetical protein
MKKAGTIAKDQWTDPSTGKEKRQKNCLFEIVTV